MNKYPSIRASVWNTSCMLLSPTLETSDSQWVMKHGHWLCVWLVLISIGEWLGCIGLWVNCKALWAPVTDAISYRFPNAAWPWRPFACWHGSAGRQWNRLEHMSMERTGMTSCVWNCIAEKAWNTRSQSVLRKCDEKDWHEICLVQIRTPHARNCHKLLPITILFVQICMLWQIWKD